MYSGRDPGTVWQMKTGRIRHRSMIHGRQGLRSQQATGGSRGQRTYGVKGRPRSGAKWPTKKRVQEARREVKLEINCSC